MCVISKSNSLEGRYEVITYWVFLIHSLTVCDTQIVRKNVAPNGPARKAVTEQILATALAAISQTHDSILIKLGDVPAEHEVVDRSAVGSNDVAGLFNGIVFNGDVLPTVRLKKVRNVFWVVGDNLYEQVVCDANAFSSLAGMVVVDSQKIHTRIGMAYYVVPKLNVFQCTPGGLSILVTHSQNNSRGEYFAFDPIALNYNPARIL